MYEEEKIFGPLTFGQFIYLAVGIVASLGMWLVFGEKSLLVGIVPIITITVVSIRKIEPKKINVKNLPEYLKRKSLSLKPKDYQKYLERRITMIVSLALIERKRGFVEYTKSNEVLNKLKDALAESKKKSG